MEETARSEEEEEPNEDASGGPREITEQPAPLGYGRKEKTRKSAVPIGDGANRLREVEGQRVGEKKRSPSMRRKGPKGRACNVMSCMAESNSGRLGDGKQVWATVDSFSCECG
ncbi:hypothetical protein NDU88_006461 [Pleurodeles waltl]|uniref:Uncharacterized protein n=1 Tax=Pleurodeles waltl TaxID=8319 RepID=A0AAV7LWY7_PLEWA|nr:hypothetical protein NDU88_006461 [Pleurodeles waltl]